MDRGWKDNEGELEAIVNGDELMDMLALRQQKGRRIRWECTCSRRNLKASEAKVRKTVQEKFAQDPFRLEKQIGRITKRSLCAFMISNLDKKAKSSRPWTPKANLLINAPLPSLVSCSYTRL